MEKLENFENLISEFSDVYGIDAINIYFIIIQSLNQLDEITDIKLNEKELKSIRNLYKVGDDLINKNK